MAKRRISSGSTFEKNIGYSRAVVDGAQCLRNIDAALREAGASFADVVRVRYILPDAADFEPCWPLLREYFAEARPAATMICAGLADPRIRIEIEVTARK